MHHAILRLSLSCLSLVSRLPAVACCLDPPRSMYDTCPSAIGSIIAKFIVDILSIPIETSNILRCKTLEIQHVQVYSCDMPLSDRS
ncbi:hypothetical protein F4821DRAFT_249570 [Hypoxylon rubiginosum]|uniref:Uncharacterized protein n=1 Tax=Hypoxylon rubiginosum TaxID=110542 RepID=A0ACC0CLS1_9PEZI|nr:hypothetical protein F4821DRAFT_249570 [Hypoxylon rubiginosum]